MAGVDDIINQGKKLFDDNKDKIQEALKSEQAEDVSDKILGGVADGLKKVIPAEHHEKIDQARDAAVNMRSSSGSRTSLGSTFTATLRRGMSCS
jgi:hypothetical protein